MDNRWRFLYCHITELWGHRREVVAGDGKPGASAGGAVKEKPYSGSRGREAERKEVAKETDRLSGKAAIAYMTPVPKTDTGGWGENPKAGGRSIVKELGKMAP